MPILAHAEQRHDEVELPLVGRSRASINASCRQRPAQPRAPARRPATIWPSLPGSCTQACQLFRLLGIERHQHRDFARSLRQPALSRPAPLLALGPPAVIYFARAQLAPSVGCRAEGACPGATGMMMRSASAAREPVVFPAPRAIRPRLRGSKAKPRTRRSNSSRDAAFALASGNRRMRPTICSMAVAERVSLRLHST